MKNISTTTKKNNFGFGKLTKENEIAINALRKEICLQMEQYDTLIGFNGFDETVKVLSMIAVNVSLSYLGKDRAKANPERFENFVKLVLSDILDKMNNAA